MAGSCLSSRLHCRYHFTSRNRLIGRLEHQAALQTSIAVGAARRRRRPSVAGSPKHVAIPPIIPLLIWFKCPTCSPKLADFQGQGNPRSCGTLLTRDGGLYGLSDRRGISEERSAILAPAKGTFWCRCRKSQPCLACSAYFASALPG